MKVGLVLGRRAEALGERPAPQRHDLGRRSRWHVEDQPVEARIEVGLYLVANGLGIADHVRPEPLGVDARRPALLQPGLGLLLRVGDDQRPQPGLRDLGRIASDVAAVPLEDRELVADGVDVAEQVARVRVLRDQAERALLSAAPTMIFGPPGWTGRGKLSAPRM